MAGKCEKTAGIAVNVQKNHERKVIKTANNGAKTTVQSVWRVRASTSSEPSSKIHPVRRPIWVVTKQETLVHVYTNPPPPPTVSLDETKNKEKRPQPKTHTYLPTEPVEQSMRHQKQLLTMPYRPVPGTTKRTDQNNSPSTKASATKRSDRNQSDLARQEKADRGSSTTGQVYRPDVDIWAPLLPAKCGTGQRRRSVMVKYIEVGHPQESKGTERLRWQQWT